MGNEEPWNLVSFPLVFKTRMWFDLVLNIVSIFKLIISNQPLCRHPIKVEWS
jgi:hypothetical protein